MNIFVQGDFLRYLSGAGVVIFSIVGGYGQFDQAWKILSTRNAQSVSVIWTMTFAAMFAGFLIQGLAKDDLIMRFQGIMRCMLYVPIFVGMYLAGCRIKVLELLLLFVVTCSLVAMSLFEEWRDFLFQSLGYFGVAMTCHQPYMIFKNKTRGKVSITILTTYNLSVIFWMIYAWLLGNMPLFYLFTAFFVVYAITMVLWKKYP